MAEKTVWLTIRRLILVVLTILVSITVLSSLLNNLSQPQVQSRLELYQANFILQAAELNEKADYASVAFLGDNPYQNVQNQYEEAIEAEQANLTRLQAQLEDTQKGASAEPVSELGISVANLEQTEKLKDAIAQTQNRLDRQNLCLGLIQVQQNNITVAQALWQNLSASATGKLAETATILQGLWQPQPAWGESAEVVLAENLEGWFRDRALSRLYELQDRQVALTELKARQQEQAEEALLKLAIIGGIPVLGGIFGFGFLIFLGVQWLVQKERSLLAQNATLAWDVPWDAEVIWQVLVVGFFFVSQIFLPLFFLILGQAIGLNTSEFSLREQVTFILASYLLMAGLGLSVLYASLKPFFPLPKQWFQVEWRSPWLLWGLGGYLVAVPLVVVVSILNQQLWDGQGGSNPILFLALQAQDTVALAIFFLVASVAAPVFEEIIFRGFLLPSLTRYLPVWGAIGVSSAIFAIAHLSPSEILPLTVLGIVLGITYTRSRNLLSSMLLHSLWNSGTLLSLFILGS